MDKTPSLSPEQLALLEQRLRGASYAQREPCIIPRRTSNKPCRLSFAQEQMWVIDQMRPGNPAYNLPVGFRIKGDLNIRALEEGLNEIVERHEVLRTTFAVKDGIAVQIVHPQCRIRIAVTELGSLSREEREKKVLDLAAEEAIRPFDLSRLPMMHASLYRLDEKEQILIINLHHIVADGISVALMINELGVLYAAITSGQAPHLPSLTIQYGDFALWQAQTVAGGVYSPQLEYWRNQLKGRLPVLDLPRDKARPAIQSFRGSNVYFRIPQTLAQELVSLGRHQGCTFFMTILAAFQVLLYRYSAAEEIVIGNMWAGLATKLTNAKQPVVYVHPREGTIGWTDFWAIAKDAPQYDLACKWIDFMVGEKFQLAWATDKDNAHCTVNTRVMGKLTDSQKRAIWIYPNPPAKLAMQQSMNQDQRQAWLDLWNEVKASQ